MKANRPAQIRQSQILKYLRQHGKALVDDLAPMFETTPQTIRKDLSTLAESNQILRFHGGAALVAGTEYTSFEARRGIARSEKDAIATVVANLIPGNTTVVINSGTTTAAVARRLQHHVGLQVVTDSVAVANELRVFAGVDVMVPGGVVRRSDGAILGESATDFIRQFRADIAVIGAAAIADDGALLDYDLQEAHVVRAIVNNARRVILAADSTKFGRLAPIRVGSFSQIDTLVVDSGCPALGRELCQRHDVELRVAG